KEVCAPGKEVCAPGKEVCAPGKEVCAPGKEVCAPGKEVCAPGKEVCAPAEDSRPEKHENKIIPPPSPSFPSKHIQPNISEYKSQPDLEPLLPERCVAGFSPSRWSAQTELSWDLLREQPLFTTAQLCGNIPSALNARQLDSAQQ
uniref:Uncharacterized protein n=1 Tax=Cyprinodon variegatus TaxID=28743 RepID=A0A3Q2CYH5_CYPVA